MDKEERFITRVGWFIAILVGVVFGIAFAANLWIEFVRWDCCL